MSRPSTRGILIAVAAGGVLGAYLRLGIAHAFPAGDGGWPWATLAANLLGTGVLAVVAVLVPRLLHRHPHLGPLWGTGFCGALTTFSTVQVEVVRLSRDGHVPLAAAYYGVSIALGLAVMWTVTSAARGVVPPGRSA